MRILLFSGSHISLIVLAMCWLGLSCSTIDDNISNSPDLRLSFSQDTVRFDTILTSRSSITQRLRVRNSSDQSINIDRISLGLANRSNYKVIVNGKEGLSIANEVIGPNDSLLVLVSVTIDPADRNLPFLVKDSLIFEWNGNLADVKLTAYGQDAVFLNKEVLCDQVWVNEKPYVIQDSVVVDASCELRIEKGTRVFFDAGGTLLVFGSLVVEGDSSDQVIFRNTRIDEGFRQIPGQWPGLQFIPGSRNNRISYTIIENAQNGIFTFGTSDVANRVQIEMDHTIIRNMSLSGIQAFTADIRASNLLVYNCGQFLFSGLVGGSYHFEHCTFSNEPNAFIRDQPSFVLLDTDPNDPRFVAPIELALANSIVWGSEQEEFFIDNPGGTPLDSSVFRNIIRSNGEIPGNFTSGEFNFPGFVNAFEFNYQLDTTSFAIDRSVESNLIDDIRGLARDSFPDLGAYEWVKDPSS